MEVEVVVGDYSSSNQESLLSQCEKISSNYDGIMHSGVIHYIKSKFGDDFVLKLAISSVLDKCPSIWPIDLPERVEKEDGIEVTDDMKKEFEELNQGLIMPIGGYEVYRIIKYAKEFITENKKGKQ